MKILQSYGLIRAQLLMIFLLAFTEAKAFDLSLHLTELEKVGVTVIPSLFTEEEMNEIQCHYQPIQDKVQEVLMTEKGHQRTFQTDGITTFSHYWKVDQDFILQAGPGRFDTSYGFREGFFASEKFLHHFAIEQIMQHTLQKEYTNYAGVVNATPKSGPQYWHRDTHNLAHSDNDGSQLLCMDDFYFTVLIP